MAARSITHSNVHVKVRPASIGGSVVLGRGVRAAAVLLCRRPVRPLQQVQHPQRLFLREVAVDAPQRFIELLLQLLRIGLCLRWRGRPALARGRCRARLRRALLLPARLRRLVRRLRRPLRRALRRRRARRRRGVQPLVDDLQVVLRVGVRRVRQQRAPVRLARVLQRLLGGEVVAQPVLGLRLQVRVRLRAVDRLPRLVDRLVVGARLIVGVALVVVDLALRRIDRLRRLVLRDRLRVVPGVVGAVPAPVDLGDACAADRADEQPAPRRSEARAPARAASARAAAAPAPRTTPSPAPARSPRRCGTGRCAARSASWRTSPAPARPARRPVPPAAARLPLSSM